MLLTERQILVIITTNVKKCGKEGIGVGVVIFLILAGLIGFLIYKYVKEGREEEVSDPSTDYTFRVKPITPPEKKAQPARYVAIYEYSQRKNARICRCCDGENSVYATKCNICGEDMN